jgi:two-component system sensor histidine kinase UhpB
MPAEHMGDMDHAVPPFLKGNIVNRSEMTAWADMLSMIGRKNSQLYEFLGRVSRPRAAGSTIVRELERERSRIARELHAGAGQPLAGIKLNLEMLDDCLAELPPRGREAVARLQTLTEQALEQVRAVSHSLHPPEWQNLTTAEALRKLVDASGLSTRLAVQLDIGPLPVEPPHTTKIALYRCAQECISNIVRHSGATRFALSLKVRATMLELRVEDNGCGFAPDPGGEGIGLRALRDHSSALGGTCDVDSGPTGTTIVVQLPLAED